ncbi:MULTISPECIES: ABC transporter substrate-binding protein [unclassified Rhodococcus (in: high G+C Gram-positive bacteria)]|uniref:ABC transporter substrate-binding protein n=1 Tax=unclassified Rhodococcus (in: high G+C Gram-positive bacteria) TaxID=192944 RepID=UPI0020CF4783|nr:MULTISPECIES: substrate-binding domain-containing protein [unclassified Rhodococcus (in: high G+C Gram-positive bacteria)]
MRYSLRSKHVITAMLLAVSTAALSACGSSAGETASVDGSWEEVVAAAEQEGSVTLYSSQNTTILDSVKAAWNAKYPNITLEYVRGTDADLNPRVEVENKTKKGIADVHVVTDTAWIASAADSGSYSQELRGPSFDNPEYDRDSSIKNNRLFLNVAATFGMGWNTDAVANGLADPRDVLAPEYKGRVGVVSPVGIASYVDLYDFYRKNFGDDYQERLAAQEPRIYPSALGIAQALTSGEIVVAPMVQPLVQEVAAGAPVNWALPNPSWGTPFYGHVTAVAPHPNAAQVLADFLVRTEGQTAQAIGVATALPGIAGATADAHDVHAPDPEKLTKQYVDQQSAEWEQQFLG